MSGLVVDCNTIGSASTASDQSYVQACQRAAEGDSFYTFKRDRAYNEILEHVNDRLGDLYFHKIAEQYPWLLPRLSRCSINDQIGNARIRAFGSYGEFSNNTMRYVCIAGDLSDRFGDLSPYRIVEFGGGYGGQCVILHTLFSPPSYVILDIQPAVSLTKRYLDACHISPCDVRSAFDTDALKGDLFFSNHAFDEIEESYQVLLAHSLLAHMPRGHIIGAYRHRPQLLAQLVGILRDAGHEVTVAAEIPQSAGQGSNVQIQWIAKSERLATAAS